MKNCQNLLRIALKINRIEVGKVDFLRDVAFIQIFYYSSEQAFSNFGQSNQWFLIYLSGTEQIIWLLVSKE